ncbi:GNAT family N-acetyltransferase [Halobacillus sp. HZG1]|uniref:GNAT family N-acetyltransferase n=1 Tax=Halobacillus sp. HZG1 TaxID=3111769 RepID=UPI002DB6C146|nr:GNAT family N-acetyltransferase [Halobacillus sp. HZG1]MEC3883048.1 GNAT family N-acetyltransferase [Halobacillus sp. HZG1]
MIRLLEPTDAKDYWDLRLNALRANPEAFAISYKEALKREDPIEGVAKYLKNKGNFTYGAFVDGVLIGVITMLQESPSKLNHKALILGMYVRTESRGNGVGRSLLQEVINKAKNIKEIERLNLTVVTSNKRAKKLYSDLGFKTYGVEEEALKFNGQYFNEAHMTLRIS